MDVKQGSRDANEISEEVCPGHPRGERCLLKSNGAPMRNVLLHPSFRAKHVEGYPFP